MTTVGIALTALVNRAGEVLLRMRDEQSTTRPNRWSLPGGAIKPGETAAGAASRIVTEQTGLTLTRAPELFWHGYLPGVPAEVYFYAAPTGAKLADVQQYPGILVQFVPGADVLSGRAFTPATGFVLGRFVGSTQYRDLAGRLDADGLA